MTQMQQMILQAMLDGPYEASSVVDLAECKQLRESGHADLLPGSRNVYQITDKGRDVVVPRV